MKICHLLKVRFDRRTAAATQDWLNGRYKFFTENTLKSLKQQTYQNFFLWINCDPGMEHPSMIEELIPLCPPGTIFSFGDKEVGWSDCRRHNILEIANVVWRNIINSDMVYVTRIDSDDLFANDALALANSCKPLEPGKVEASVFCQGWMLDVTPGREGKVGVYNNPSSPFHTIMFPTSTFLDARKYEEVWHKIGDHSRVRNALPSQVLPHWKFTVLIHGNNFLSNMDYSATPDEFVPKDWNTQRWMDQPVVFDLDDHCDQHGEETLSDLDKLKKVYPALKVTLFTIPAKTSLSLLQETAKMDWIEIAVHGINHVPNEELREVSGEVLSGWFKDFQYIHGEKSPYIKGFRPPGWFIKEEHVEACNKLGLWVALHVRDRKMLGPLCEHGFYCCDDRLPYHHGHTHNVCGNWLRKDMDKLLTKWRKDQKFAFVSEALLVKQGGKK